MSTRTPEKEEILHQPQSHCSAENEYLDDDDVTFSRGIETTKWNLQSPNVIEGDKFWSQVLHGAQAIIQGIRKTQTTDNVRNSPSKSPILSLSDIITSTELRIRSSFDTPICKPNSKRGVSQLERKRTRVPVRIHKLAGGVYKELTGGKLQTFQNLFVKGRPAFKSLLSLVSNNSSPILLGRRGTPTKSLKVYATEHVCHAGKNIRNDRNKFPNNRGVLLPRKNLRTNKHRHKRAKKGNICTQPLKDPERSLSLFIKQISSDDWNKKVKGMGILQGLARNHSLILKPKLHLVCSFIIAELKNGCPAVVSSAINTLHELYVHLKTAMDPEAGITGQALLLKTKENISATTQEEINAALEALVQNCGYTCVADVLLNIGVCHRSVPVRYTTAKLLHQLANRLGVDRVMTAGKGLNELFLVAVSKLSMDAAQEVRDHGQKILRELSVHKTFQMLCKRALPERNRIPLARILGNPAANDYKRRDEPRLNTRAKVVPNVYGHKTTANKVDELPTGNQKIISVKKGSTKAIPIPNVNPTKLRTLTTAKDSMKIAEISLVIPHKETGNDHIPPTTKNKTAKPLTKPRKIITNRCSQQTATNQNAELKPLTDPEKSLSLFFTQLSSDDWEKKVNGMNVIRALARHHSLVLKPKLKQVCQILSAEVKNLRSAVSCLSINTLRELYINLQTAMDVEAETTGRALLLKLGDKTLEFVNQSVQTALDAMVENCSSKFVIKILFDTGLHHRSVLVKGTTAKLFHQVVEKMGVDKLMTASRHQAESLLLAISKLAVDPAQEVRHYGRAILQDMSLHKGFEKLWMTVVPDSDRYLLQNVLNRRH